MERVPELAWAAIDSNRLPPRDTRHYKDRFRRDAMEIGTALTVRF
jgi:hypothetical protein